MNLRKAPWPAAHELATSMVFTSGLTHFADKPEFFETLPKEVLRLLREVPARWDESRCLAGEPGETAVFARRAGQEWFVAGLNGSSHGRTLDLDFSAFRDFPKRLLVKENPSDLRMKVSCENLPSSNKFQHTLPPRGGFVLRISR